MPYGLLNKRYLQLRHIFARILFKERFESRELPAHTMIYRRVNKFRIHRTVNNLNRTVCKGHYTLPRHCMGRHLKTWHHLTIVVRGRQRMWSLTINTERYVQVLGKFWTALSRRRRVVMDIQQFQQDGAAPTPQTNHWHIYIIVSLIRCDSEWSTHSPDLNAPDFPICGDTLIKNRVYGNNPQTTPDRKVTITAAIRETQREEYGRVTQNFARRIQMRLQQRGAFFRAHFWSAS